MTTPQLIVSIIYFIVSLALVAIVMLQSGKSEAQAQPGIGPAVGGGEDDGGVGLAVAQLVQAVQRLGGQGDGGGGDGQGWYYI